MVVALGLWTLLDSGRLYRSATGSRLGARRSAALAVLRPLHRLRVAVGVDGERPRSPARPAPVRVVPTEARTIAAAPRRVVARPEPLRAGTSADPLRVLVVGDSVADGPGQRLAARLAPTGRIVTTVDARPSTGLSRPDSFDWPAHLADDLARGHPDVVVAMWGANDAQAMPLRSGAAPFASPAWLDAYVARARAVTDEVLGAGARLVWVGEPVMRSAAFDHDMQVIAGAVQGGMGRRAGAMFSDAAQAVATPDGRYADALPDAAGHQHLVRATDGVHLTWEGADRLAAAEVADLARL